MHTKLQSPQRWNVECVGWSRRCIDGADCVSLQHFFKEILQAKMKKEIKFSCTAKNMFIGKSDKDEDEKLKRNGHPTKEFTLTH